MAIKPAKFIRATFGAVSVAASTSVSGTPGVPYRWNVTLQITSQAHSDNSTTPIAGFYDGRNVAVGDWIVSDGDGRALKVVTISSANANSVSCVLEDYNSYNARKDETGNLDGMIQAGSGIVGYIFEVKNGVPVLSSIPNALPGNLNGTQFAANLISRFASEFNVGLDDATGKLPASIVPVGTASSIGGVRPNGDSFAVDAAGVMTLKPATATTLGGVKTVSGNPFQVNAATGVATVTLTSADVPPIDWSKIGSGRPTTLSGYGITDAPSRGDLIGTDAKILPGLLPMATASAFGGVKSGASVIVDASGFLGLSVATASLTGGVRVPTTSGVKIDASGNLTLGAASASVLGAVKVAASGAITLDANSVLTFTEPVATASAVGGVRVPSTGPLTVDASGVLGLVAASTVALGGVKASASIPAAADGTLSLAIASTSVLGGVKTVAGNPLQVNASSGVATVSATNIASYGVTDVFTKTETNSAISTALSSYTSQDVNGGTY
jgi:hypothetical protein